MSTQPLKAYAAAIGEALSRSLCLTQFPSQRVDGYYAPEVEVAHEGSELLLPKIEIRRNASESCLIEPSINSVRISLKLHAGDALEVELVRSYTRFLMQRADALRIIRRVPVPGYDVSFLITAQHLAGPGARQQLVDWLVEFVMECDAEINGLKLDINARGRAVATSLLRSLAF
ncbi:actin-related protein ArpC4 [Haematococcus lacustris]|nr:hypothetical protein QJQ45_015096 [Haematococcus lacustris]